MLTIFQGDDTAANGRTIRLRLPDEVIGDGFAISFRLFGLERSGEYEPGGTLEFNYSRQETAAFPLGVTYGEMRLCKGGLEQTISNTVPVRVTDSVAEAYPGDAGAGNAIDLSVVVNTGVSRIDKAFLTKASSIADIKSLANAILEAINGAAAQE